MENNYEELQESRIPELKVEKTEVINDLNFIEIDGEWKITSLEIARFTGKRHDHLLRDIREMEPDWINSNAPRFGGVNYLDKKGESRFCYAFNEKEAVYVISKYNNELRAKLIQAFYKLKEMYEKGEIADSASIKNLVNSINKLIDSNNEKDAQVKQLINYICEKRDINMENDGYVLRLRDIMSIYHVPYHVKLSDVLVNNGIIEWNEKGYPTFTEKYKDCGRIGNNNTILYNKKGVTVVKELIDKLHLSK